MTQVAQSKLPDTVPVDARCMYCNRLISMKRAGSMIALDDDGNEVGEVLWFHKICIEAIA